MLHGSPVVALVPARDGSKGLPGKNLQSVGGISLVGRAVLSAVQCSKIDSCFVSSDSAEILAEGRKWGAKEHQRPASASTDFSLASDVISAFLPTLMNAFPGLDPFLVYLQPTSPLRNATHVDACLQMLEEENDQLAVSVSERPIYLDKLVTIDSTGVTFVAAEVESARNRQDLKEYWAPNGAIYVFRASLFCQRGKFPLAGARPYWMDVIASTDVDSMEDLMIANALMRSIDAGILDS